MAIKATKTRKLDSRVDARPAQALELWTLEQELKALEARQKELRDALSATMSIGDTIEINVAGKTKTLKKMAKVDKTIAPEWLSDNTPWDKFVNSITVSNTKVKAVLGAKFFEEAPGEVKKTEYVRWA